MRPEIGGTAGLDVRIAWRLRNSWQATALLRRTAETVLAAEGFRAGHLSVAVVGRTAMATLHLRFMDVAGPTDVLTFDLDSDVAAGRIDAEIVVCADVARRNAAARGGTLRAAREELALYLVHGILHVAGYDDHEPRDAARMHRREDELLSICGLPPVYREGA